MAQLLAKQDSQNKFITVSRGQEVEGKVVTILSRDIIVDLGTKSEGTISKKELSQTIVSSLKLGDKIKAFVAQAENDSGQVLLVSQKPLQHTGQSFARGFQAKKSSQWRRFEDVLKSGEAIKGIGIEVNKGGLIIETNGMRGFLPTSQVTLSQAADMDKMIGKEFDLTVIEVDPNHNRLIFSQKTNISDSIKEKLENLETGTVLEADVTAILPFGIYVTFDYPSLQDAEGLIHISEIAWEKQEDIGSKFKKGDKIKAKVISVDPSMGRLNLSIKQLQEDPFGKAAEKFKPDDVVKGTVEKVSTMGVTVDLGEGITGLMHSSRLEGEVSYQVGQEITCIIDSVDIAKRKISLAPFITSTKDLIYK